MSWALVLLFCLANADCRAVPVPMPGDGYRSQSECLMQGALLLKERGATHFICRARLGQEQSA